MVFVLSLILLGQAAAVVCLNGRNLSPGHKKKKDHKNALILEVLSQKDAHLLDLQMPSGRLSWRQYVVHPSSM